jgi:hypothetical protein
LSAVNKSAFASRLLAKHSFVIDSRVQFGYELYLMAVGAKAVNDLSVDTFVCDDIQLTFSNG